MPRKIRQLKADLRQAGFVQIPRRGKGSHTVWRHSALADKITLSGADGDDAQPYQEQRVKDAIVEATRRQ